MGRGRPAAGRCDSSAAGGDAPPPGSESRPSRRIVSEPGARRRADFPDVRGSLTAPGIPQGRDAAAQARDDIQISRQVRRLAEMATTHFTSTAAAGGVTPAPRPADWSRPRLGELLVRKGYLSADQVEWALQRAKEEK